MALPQTVTYLLTILAHAPNTVCELRGNTFCGDYGFCHKPEGLVTKKVSAHNLKQNKCIIDRQIKPQP